MTLSYFSLDLNECDRNPCPADSVCFNTDGSYECRCNVGNIYDVVTGECVCEYADNDSPKNKCVMSVCC